MQEVLRTGDPVRASSAIATLADAGIEAVLADLKHPLAGRLRRRHSAPRADRERACQPRALGA